MSPVAPLSDNLSTRSALVLGLGKSGLGSISLLRRHGARVFAADDRSLSDLPAVHKLVEKEEISFLSPAQAATATYDFLVLSPGVPREHPVVLAALAHGRPVIGEVELAFAYLSGPVAAITGSNGKTTTTTLTGLMLSASQVPCQVGGNIGFAVTDLAVESRPLQWNVLEISSFQLESVSTFHAQIAAVLNVTPNHLDRHGTFESYCAAKGRIFAHQKAADWAVLNPANPASAAYAAALPSRIAWFQDGAARVHGDTLELFGAKLMRVSDVLLPGAHNLENVMAAAVIASLAGATHEAIAQVAATFGGVPHRLEFIREWRGIRFYNDSKATSVDAALKAIAALPAPLWVILGGKGKGASYTPLLPLLREKAKALLLIGEDAPTIAQDLSALPLENSGDLATAIAHAARHASPGDTVLLAPACASYDQFNSYEHRGNTFRELVEAL